MKFHRIIIGLALPLTVFAQGSDSAYLTARDAFRTDDIYRADLSLNISFLPWKSVEVFVEPQVLNVFNNQNVQTVNASIQTRANTGSASYAAFNPFTEQPKQGPAATGGATPTNNWNYASTFGTASSRPPTSSRGPSASRWASASRPSRRGPAPPPRPFGAPALAPGLLFFRPP